MSEEILNVKGQQMSKNGFGGHPENINRVGGPPKTHWWTELYKKELELESEKIKGLKKKEVIVKRTVEKAEEAEQWAVKEVGDRVAGKTPQGIGTIDDEGSFKPQNFGVAWVTNADIEHSTGVPENN